MYNIEKSGRERREIRASDARSIPTQKKLRILLSWLPTRLISIKEGADLVMSPEALHLEVVEIIAVVLAMCQDIVDEFMNIVQNTIWKDLALQMFMV